MIARPAGRGIVIALGGNALQPPGGRGDIHEQFAHTRESLAPIVALAAEGWKIAVVHGNGPQIGDELHRNECARDELPPLPLGVLVAATAGWIGYMVQQSLENALARAGVERRVATVITQVLVDADDPASLAPSKPIGRLLSAEAARALEEFGCVVAQTADGWRRLAPSPRPREIVERDQIRRLVESGTIVIAAGGGGTPVYRHPRFGFEGVDAVIDKDRAAAVLAGDIAADALLILTNVEGVFADFGTPSQRLLSSLSAEDAQRRLEAGEFGTGSMAPKVEAALDFLAAGGQRVHIARLDQGLDAVGGNAGTTIVAER